MLSAIILAAGESSRMGGRPKALLETRGRKFVEIIAAKAREAGAEEIVVVTGAHTKEIKNSADLPGARIAENIRWRDGQLSSVKTGIAALSPQSGGFILALCDSPMAEAATYKMLADAWRKDNSRIYLPVTPEGRQGHPAIFPAKFYRVLMEENLPEGAKTILRKHPSEVTRIVTADGGILTDIDTPDDYEKIK